MSADVRNSATNASEVIGEEYASSLADLTVNSKPLINMLTMLAEENVDYADVIVRVIEKHLSQVKPEMKLPVLYLVDSIVKNIGRDYTQLFTQNIVSTFCGVFEKVDESTRASMFKLRQTWSDVFPPKKLYALDVRVKSIDPAWPITAPLPTAASIHLNPAFLPKSSGGAKGSGKSQPSQASTRTPVTTAAIPSAIASAPAPTPLPGDLTETEMRENLLRKQKELIELQQKKIEIELLQTKARLQQQQIQAAPLIPPEPPAAMTSLKPAIEELAKMAPKPAAEPSAKPVEMGPPVKAESDDTKAPPAGSQRPAVRRSKSPDKSSASPSKKFKEDRHSKDKRKRKDSNSSGSGKDRARKGKESSEDVEEDRAADEADGQASQKPRNLREAAKSMPRIPKISDRPTAAAASRDPRLQHKQPAAERRKIQEPTKKEHGGEHKKRRRFDDLFGNEDIDLRKAPTPSGPPSAAPVARDSPPRGGHWGPKRGPHRGRGWAGPPRGGRGGRRPMGEEAPGPWMDGPGEDSWEGPMGPEDGGGSPQNMDIILEQAKENHRNGVINDGEYSTIIRQMFQMSESKMIREVQRRDQDLRYAGPSWNEPAGREPRDPRRFPNFPTGRPSRFGERIPPGRMNAFEVRPDEGPVKTINIDNVPREIRFYGDTAIILMAADDPRELGFQPGVRRVFIDNVTAVECVIGSDYVDFSFEGCIHQIKLGAPTRELYVDGQWFECMFGGPPVTVPLGNRPVQMALEAPPPTVKIGTERRLDLLAGRVTMIIDAHSVIPVYLDLKLQHFDLDGKVYTLQFKDALRTVVIDNFGYHVDFGGLPMAIQLDGRKHFVRFSALPRGVEPGRVLQPMQPQPHFRPDEMQPQVPAAAAAGTAAAGALPGAPVDIGELLSKLVATGLLPGTGAGAPDAKPSAAKEELKADKVRAKEEPKFEEIREVNLKDSESMKIRPNGVVSMLYSGMQCGSCGLRFPAEQTVRYSAHLDWHFRQNRREKGASKRPQSRKWYYKVADWIQFEETESVDNDKRLNWFEAQAGDGKDHGQDRNGDELMPEESASVPVGALPEENRCVVCHENLEQFFHEESEEWHLKDAVRIDGVTYHRLCSRDYLSGGPYIAESGDEPTASEAEEAAMESESESEAERKVKAEVADSPATSYDTDSLPAIKEEQEDTVDSADVSVDLGRVKMEKNDVVLEPEPVPAVEADVTSQDVECKTEEAAAPEAEYVPEAPKCGVGEAERKEQEERPATPPPEEATPADELFIPEAVISTPTVVTSIDGNVELPAAEVAPVVTAPPKIKINLFKKLAAPSPVPPPSPPKSPISAAPGTTATDDTRLNPTVSTGADLTTKEDSEAENDQEVPPPPDEAALANKPRLIGRKLTVLPPKSKGTELSGLCSIM